MVDRLVAIDTDTFLFPQPVRDAYFADIHNQIVTQVSNLDGVATAVANKVTPLVTDGLVNPLLVTATSTRDSLDARYRAATIIRVTTSNAPDYTTVIQNALDAGNDVEIIGPATGAGICKTTQTLRLNVNTFGQRLTTKNATIQPAHPGDGIQVTTKSTVSVTMTGALQPTGTDYSLIAAIRIGGTSFGYNPQQAAAPYCDIRNWAGSAIIWEHGAMVDFTHTYISDVTIDGFTMGFRNDDNNHGHFVNTHVVRAGRYGYATFYPGTYVNAYYGDLGGGVTGYSSSAHQFLNAKAFGCGQNFHIETHSNVGTVFSELGTVPDTFDTNSRANDITVIGTVTAGESWTDYGPDGSNQLTIYANGDYRVHRNLRARNFFLGTVKWTGAFSGKYSTGTISIPNGTIVDIAPPGVNGLGSGRTVQATPFSAGNQNVMFSHYIDATGNLHFQFLNLGATKNYSATVSYTVMAFG